MLKFAERMPARKALIDRFVYGQDADAAGSFELDFWGSGSARHAVGY